MPDNKTIRGPQDQLRINVHEDHEVRYWAKALGVTEEKLKELVTKHGVSAKEIRRVLHIPDRKRVG
jgi:Protein of unknown function (DUF3606)